MVIGSSTINWVMDTVVPELSGIGTIGDVEINVTEITEIAIDPVNTVIQNFTWVTGVLYLFGILGVFGLAFVFRGSRDKWLIGLFFAMVVILVIACIFISNIYEEFYNGTDTLATIMKEHVLLSYLILYSPEIMSLIAFIAGIILFSGDSEGFV